MERAYKAYAKVNGGAGPTPLATADGGADALFRPMLRLMPAAPANYTWSYGQHAADGSVWDGLHYFCLSSAAPADLGIWRGMIRAKQAFSAEQLFMGNSCGATTNLSEPTTYPASVSVTYFVTATAAD